MHMCERRGLRTATHLQRARTCTEKKGACGNAARTRIHGGEKKRKRKRADCCKQRKEGGRRWRCVAGVCWGGKSPEFDLPCPDRGQPMSGERGDRPLPNQDRTHHTTQLTPNLTPAPFPSPPFLPSPSLSLSPIGMRCVWVFFSFLFFSFFVPRPAFAPSANTPRKHAQAHASAQPPSRVCSFPGPGHPAATGRPTGRPTGWRDTGPHTHPHIQGACVREGHRGQGRHDMRRSPTGGAESADEPPPRGSRVA